MAKVYSDIKKKSTVRKVISTILGIIFLVLLVVGIIIGTYVFSSPSKDNDSGEIIKGQWLDEKNNICFTFDKEGNFKMQTIKNEKVDETLAKGYFKINEDGKEIKILVSENNIGDKFDLGFNYKYFTTIVYKDLNATKIDQFSNSQSDKSTCKFVALNGSSIFECKRINTLATFYGDKKNDDLKH